MDKQRDSDGFTAIEMMLTLMIVSILIMVTVIHIPKHKDINNDEVLNIGYLFQSAQTSAISEKTPHIVEVDYINHRLNVKDSKGKSINSLNLDSCQLKRGGLDRFIYRQNGDTSAFGTIRMTCSGNPVSFIFQINNGRFRVEQ